MDITIETRDDITIVAMSGEIDGKTASEAQRTIGVLCQPASKLLLDMSNVSYMSSAGLRLMLSLYRQVYSVNGRMVLVCLSDELKDTMSATGFLSHFITADTLDDGMTALQ